MDEPQGWKVLSQRQTTALDTTGRYVPVVEITYQAGDGTVRTVKVPEARYSVDAVRSAIEADAETAQAVNELHG